MSMEFMMKMFCHFFTPILMRLKPSGLLLCTIKRQNTFFLLVQKHARSYEYLQKCLRTIKQYTSCTHSNSGILPPIYQYPRKKDKGYCLPSLPSALSLLGLWVFSSIIMNESGTRYNWGICSYFSLKFPCFHDVFPK